MFLLNQYFECSGWTKKVNCNLICSQYHENIFPFMASNFFVSEKIWPFARLVVQLSNFSRHETTITVSSLVCGLLKIKSSKWFVCIFLSNICHFVLALYICTCLAHKETFGASWANHSEKEAFPVFFCWMQEIDNYSGSPLKCMTPI